jgi:hypothetical protein
MSDEDRVSDEDLENAMPGAGDSLDDDPSAEDDQVDDETNDTDDGEPTGDDDGQPDDDDGLPAEPEDNAERSRLGRKVATLEGKLDRIVDLMEKGLTQQQAVDQAEEEEDIDLDEDDTLTVGGLMKILDHRDKQVKKEESKETQYQTDYREGVSGALAEIDASLHEAVMEEFKANHNVRRSKDAGVADATSNIKDAYIAVLQGKANVKTTQFDKNGEGDDDGTPLGGKTGGKNPPKKLAKKIKLDPAAADYAAAVGLSDEDVQEALEGEAPAYLQGGR